MLKGKGWVSMQCDKSNIDPKAIAARYKPPERSDEQVDHQKAGKISDQVSKTYCREELLLPDGSSTYCKKLINVLIHSESKHDTQFESTKVVQHQLEL